MSALARSEFLEGLLHDAPSSVLETPAVLRLDRSRQSELMQRFYSMAHAVFRHAPQVVIASEIALTEAVALMLEVLEPDDHILVAGLVVA